MVTTEGIKNAKEIISHIVAVLLILQMIIFIGINAFNKSIKIPTLVISLGSGAVELYLSR